MSKNKFIDGIKSFTSALINRRTATAENYVQADRLSDVSLRNIYRTGLGSKIVRIKAGDALKDTLQFEISCYIPWQEPNFAPHILKHDPVRL